MICAIPSTASYRFTTYEGTAPPPEKVLAAQLTVTLFEARGAVAVAPGPGIVFDRTEPVPLPVVFQVG
jgi:hypothetical protein